MSRILLTWELGLNRGHLARLLPIAQRLKADGDVVLVAARDIQTASELLGPSGIPFVQAPHLPKGISLAHRAAGYSDILLSQGWSDTATLWGLTQAWLNLLRMYRPERLILDYSPTVSLAARIERIPCVLIGNGFELPPLEDPLPPFPGFSWATADRAAQSESLAVANANRVLRSFGGRAIAGLRDLTIGESRLLATFPELDHYPARPSEHYIGPMLGSLPNTKVVTWPHGEGPKIFACVRPDTSHARVILEALATIDGRVICVTPGFTEQQVAPFRRDHTLFTTEPVNLAALGQADLCISYGAEGTMMTFLLAGAPQLILPWHVETFMAGRRLEAASLGRSLETALTVALAQSTIRSLAIDSMYRARVAAFAELHAKYVGTESLSLVMASIHRKAQRQGKPSNPDELSCQDSVARIDGQVEGVRFLSHSGHSVAT